MSKIVQISPCSGWFHVSGDDQKWNVHVIAAWAVLESGDIVGLVPVTPVAGQMQSPKLVPTASGGQYISESKLTFSQKATLVGM